MTLLRCAGALLLFATAIAARDVPPYAYPLVDEVRLLDEQTAGALRQVSLALKRETGAELAVLVTGTTAGEDARAFGLRVFNSWRIGQAGRDDGVLLLFAMRDRRVEVLVGVGFEPLFPADVCSALLEQHVVPRMRSGDPRGAVLAGGRAIADRIRSREAAPAPEPERASAPTPIAPAAALPQRPAPGHEVPAAASRMIPDGRGLIRIVVLVGLVGWAVVLGSALQRTFATGHLPLGRSSLYALSLLGPLTLGGLLFAGSAGARAEPVDWGLGGGGGVGGLVFVSLVGHVCHRCNKWMSIHSRTLVHATYSSSGTGERTYHCGHCNYHKVETYRIPRRTHSRSRSRSSYSSSSRSSGGRSSFGGGGRSRGGGGGASW